MKPSITYLLGLGHSGTTILQYLLACGRGTLGLGEVRKVADGSGWEADDARCSCGAHVAACPTWSDLKPDAGETATQWYRRTADTLSHRYSDAPHWIDTSKTPEGLQPWLELHRQGVIENVRILFLVRDIRGWVVSDEKTRQRKQRPIRPLLMPILSWWRAQGRIEHFLTADDLDYRVVSYEGLMFRTQDTMTKIADYTKIDDLQLYRAANLGGTEVHDVFGNRLKDNPARRSQLVYEDEWQYRAWLNILVVLTWPAWRMNIRLRRNTLASEA